MTLNLLLKSGKTVFKVNEIGNILGINNNNYLFVYVNRLKKRGEIKMIKKGLYALTDNFNYFELANKLRSPSYVSFQTVLFKEGIIFQDFENTIISAGPNSYKTTILGKQYIYHKLKPEFLAIPKGIKNDGLVKIATPERAIIDCLYIYNNYHFDNLEKINKELLFDIAKEFGDKIFKKIKKNYA
ncbi:MAG: hypothetical protein NZM02_02955 [Patescibacteria group bacterium]|nr:hypothetical protein [Patescibacteria group bacterium]